MKGNIKNTEVAPSIESPYQETGIVYYDELEEKFCIRYSMPMLCFCTSVDECALYKGCKYENLSLKCKI